jgi:hypothetical protein
VRGRQGSRTPFRGRTEQACGAAGERQSPASQARTADTGGAHACDTHRQAIFAEREHREREGAACYREARRRGWEGIIAKNENSTYIPARTYDSLKVKCVKEQELVIGGYTDLRGTRIGFGALLVGYCDHGQLVYAGKVGAGFDAPTLQRLRKQLAQLATATSPFTVDDPRHGGVHWAEPKLVAQVRFTEWTRDGKLRHPQSCESVERGGSLHGGAPPPPQFAVVVAWARTHRSTKVEVASAFLRARWVPTLCNMAASCGSPPST